MEHREAVDERTPLDCLIEAEELTTASETDPAAILVAAVIMADWAADHPDKWRTVRARLLIRTKTSKEIASGMGIHPATMTKHMASLRTYATRREHVA